MMRFVFNSTARENFEEIAKAVNLLYKESVPVIVCIGSDLVIGDSLGPIVGTKLSELLKDKAFVYGTLDNPITAKEITTVKETLSSIHPNAKIIVIDAAVGNKEDVGQVKISSFGIKPGLGVNKTLPCIGDVSIIGIVKETGNACDSLSLVRLGLINTLANDIAKGLSLAFLKI